MPVPCDCISETSTGVDCSWGIDNASPAGAITSSDTQISSVTASALGSPADVLASAFAASVTGHGAFVATYPGSGNCFSLNTAFDLYVGAANQTPTCKVSPHGCADNPIIRRLSPTPVPARGAWGLSLLGLLIMPAAAVLIHRSGGEGCVTDRSPDVEIVLRLWS